MRCLHTRIYPFNEKVTRKQLPATGLLQILHKVGTGSIHLPLPFRTCSLKFRGAVAESVTPDGEA